MDFFLSDEAKQFVGYSLLEMHVLQGEAERIRGKLMDAGFRANISAAESTGRSEEGTSGGTATITRSHIAVAPMARSTAEQEATLLPLARGTDWTATIVQLKGMPMLIISIYLTCSIGLAGTNLLKLAEVENLISETGITYCLMGDFNCTPEELTESGWLRRVRGDIVHPEGLVATCNRGGSSTSAWRPCRLRRCSG